MAYGDDLDFKIVQKMGVLSRTANGQSKQLNLVSWNGKAEVYDIRRWSADGSPLKGITLNKDEARALYEVLAIYF